MSRQECAHARPTGPATVVPPPPLGVGWSRPLASPLELRTARAAARAVAWLPPRPGHGYRLRGPAGATYPAWSRTSTPPLRQDHRLRPLPLPAFRHQPSVAGAVPDRARPARLDPDTAAGGRTGLGRRSCRVLLANPFSSPASLRPHGHLLHGCPWGA